LKEKIILLKSEVAHLITSKLGLPDVHFSTGSTEPKELFLQIANCLAIDISDVNSKPTIARRIVEASGEVWLPDYESSGSTVTIDGLKAVHSAVEFFLAGRPETN
jgi:hypothetical protein